jgi:hypothetical protein
VTNSRTADKNVTTYNHGAGSYKRGTDYVYVCQDVLDWGSIPSGSTQAALSGCRLVKMLRNDDDMIGLDCVGRATNCRGPAAQQKCVGGPAPLHVAAVDRGTATIHRAASGYTAIFLVGINLCVTRVNNPETEAVMAIQLLAYDDAIAVAVYRCRKDGGGCGWIMPDKRKGCYQQVPAEVRISGQWVVPASDSWIIGVGFYIQNDILALQFETS